MSNKRIGQGGQDACWNTDLVEQLGFIRRHLRYPISRKTAVPVIMIASVIPSLLFIIYLILNARATGSAKPVWFPILLVCLMLVPGIAVARRYISTLRFISVPARRTMPENMLLMQNFLRQNHFAIGRHPDAPEVFQIISRSISQLNDEREVVIFIADDHRILVNSHFTQNRFKLAIGHPHYRELSAMLAAWIRQQDEAETRDITTFRK